MSIWLNKVDVNAHSSTRVPRLFIRSLIFEWLSGVCVPEVIGVKFWWGRSFSVLVCAEWDSFFTSCSNSCKKWYVCSTIRLPIIPSTGTSSTIDRQWVSLDAAFRISACISRGENSSWPLPLYSSERNFICSNMPGNSLKKTRYLFSAMNFCASIKFSFMACCLKSATVLSYCVERRTKWQSFCKFAAKASLGLFYGWRLTKGLK